MRDATHENIRHAAMVLRLGGLVAMPTETVYGLAANALDAAAAARIFEAKRRPSFDPLIVHAADTGAAFALAQSVPDAAKKLAAKFWPGPLTLVLPKQPAVPDIVTSGLPAVALRVPAHNVALALIREAGVPLAAPSANRFGGVSPTCAAHVRDELGDPDDKGPGVHPPLGEDATMPDLILDGGPCAAGVESTVISFADGVPTLLRPGALPIEEVEAVIGHIERGRPVLDAADRPAGPGMLKRHYSPATPMTLIEHGCAIPPAPEGKKIGLLCASANVAATARGYHLVEPLCAGSFQSREAATSLFAAMRRLDASRLDMIVAQLVDEHGLGLAINDRLRRAAAK